MIKNNPNYNLIKKALRGVARYMPSKQKCLELAKHPTEKGKRGGAMYICAHCGLCFPLKDVQVDHIEPVAPLDKEIEDWNEYIERIFCDHTKLQVLCKECHQVKSNRENEERRNNGF
jgi:5-methylcytosine-specific restriction endonuclease McrA